VLEETGINPSSLVLEITESAVLDDPQRANETLKALKQLGVKLALDDFGTGYSSLSYLKQFPIDVLKIDKSFISDLHVSEKEAALTGATIALGQRLRLRIVAEGIESADQLHHLQGLHCDEGQGFLFSQPLSRTDLDRFLQANVERQSAKVA
jgi:EAL domain-containing protein (putative c-di-GMP-specific phosphodiesterase class I)